MVIDSHQHFWHYTPAEYDWISTEMAVIQRDFLPEDLLAVMAATGVDGAISVQARQSLAETAWLLELAQRCARLRGVVGWVPLCEPTVESVLERLAVSSALRGVRHVVQGEPDDEFILRPDFNRGIAALRRFDLAYDILILERHLPATLRFVDRHPQQHFILDHIAKPRVRDGLLEPWASRLRELARRPHVWCKLSGVVTEADPCAWTVEQVRPYLQTVLEAFGPERVLFGSDWPVCLVACPYGRWLDIVRTALADFTVGEQAAILGGNASRAYRLPAFRASAESAP